MEHSASLPRLTDLHVHSSVSDGTLSPQEVTALALETGLASYALTDHDATDGVMEAVRAAAGTPLEVVPGIEISSTLFEKEIHILGLYVNPTSSALTQALARLRKRRSERNEAMLRRFQRDGFQIEKADLFGENGGISVITRAHFARALLKKGYVSSTDQAFKRYLDQGRPYFLPKETLAPDAAIHLIREAGGFPALAHPLQYKLGWKRTEEMATLLTSMGLMGLEVYYSSHSQSDSQALREMASRLGLLPTGGSDFHGANKPDIRLGSGRGGLRVSDLLRRDIRTRLESGSD